MICPDFETKAIENRPAYPPAAVGVGLGGDHMGPTRYLAWGHPKGNNLPSPAKARAALEIAWEGGLLFHNAAFDLCVAHEGLGLPLPDGSQIDDTMVIAFLLNPYGELSLKPLAQQHLGIPPTERDAVREWLKANYKMPTGRPPTDKQCGAFISEAPGELVAPYSVGDVDRTIALFKCLLPKLEPAGLLPAYRREMDIMPMLLDNSARGIPLDRVRLAKDTKAYEALLLKLDKEIRMNWPKEVGFAAPEDLDSGDEIAAALSLNRSLQLRRTPTGKLSTAKDALMDALPNWRIKGLLLYRSALCYSLENFMRPWLTHGAALHANWNQVRTRDERGEDMGARTGRLSSSPNMQNITNPDKYDELIELMQACRVPNANRYTLPNLRSYLVAPKGHVLFSRDYSQQELRFLAHFEDGVLAQAYRDNPDLDVHDFVRDLIYKSTRIALQRKPTKTINFGKVYGMGGPMLSKKLRIELDMAYELIGAYDAALPSVKSLQREINSIGKRGDFITTIGGRRYYSPPATTDDLGNTKTFEYKLLNYLVQGSSADQTKEAMRLWWPMLRNDGDTRFLLTVHDQLVGCAPKGKALKASKLLDTCMRDAFKLDVPIKTDPTYGYNFGEMTTELPR